MMNISCLTHGKALKTKLVLAVEIIITLLNHADICLYIYLLFIFDDTFFKRCLKLTVCQYGKGYVWYRDNISKEGVQFSSV